MDKMKWKCPKCNTVNRSTVCTVCGTPVKKRYMIDDPEGETQQWNSVSDEVNPLHWFSWVMAFSHILFFFFGVLSVVHPDTGRETVAMFMLNRYLSRWGNILADYTRISLIFNGMNTLFLAITGVLAVVCVHKITRRDAHGLTPYLILSNITGLLPALTFYAVFSAASRMRSLYGVPAFSGLGKIQLVCALVGIAAAVAGCILSWRQTAEEDKPNGFAEEEAIIPEVLPAGEIAIPEAAEKTVSPTIVQADNKASTQVFAFLTHREPEVQTEGGRCSRCGRILRPVSIYCNVCAKPVHKP